MGNKIKTASELSEIGIIKIVMDNGKTIFSNIIECLNPLLNNEKSDNNEIDKKNLNGALKHIYYSIKKGEISKKNWIKKFKEFGIEEDKIELIFKEMNQREALSNFINNSKEITEYIINK